MNRRVTEYVKWGFTGSLCGRVEAGRAEGSEGVMWGGWGGGGEVKDHILALHMVHSRDVATLCGP